MLSRLSLRSRLLLGVVVLAAVGLAAADAVMYTSLRTFLLGRVDAGLEVGHRIFEHPAPSGQQPSHDSGDLQGPPPEGVDWYEVRTLGGRVLRGGSLVEGISPPRVPAKIVLPTRPNSGDEYVSYFDAPARNGDESYRVRGSIEPDRPHQILLVAESLSGVDGTLHRLLLIEAIATAAVLAVLAALALWVVRLGLRPLREIELTAAAITAGDLSHRVDHPDARTEVGRVGSALNEMLDRIEASDRRLRRFVADASHELRTPLTSIRGYAELLRKGALDDEASRRRAAVRIEHEATRMGVLVDDLLLLARLDQGRPIENAPVDLTGVVIEAVDAARAADPAHPVTISASHPVMVVGDAGRLRQVADNLLHNASVHTPPGTPVLVEVGRSNGHAVLVVADEGPGLTAEEAAHVFDRFYRGEEARRRPGTGLGLSIVGALAAAHGGRALARTGAQGGAEFVVELPLVPSTDSTAPSGTMTGRDPKMGEPARR